MSFSNWLLNKISKLDFIGHKFTFESEDSDRHRTFEGGFFSAIIFIVAVVMAIIIGQEVYKRKDPIVASSNEYLDYSEVYLKDYPIMFAFYDTSARELPNIHKYLEFEVSMTTISEDSSQTSFYSNYTLVDCNDQLEHFSNENKFYVEELLTKTNYKYLCINFDDSMKFQNSVGSNNSTIIHILMFLCREEISETCDLSDNFMIYNSVNLAITFVDSYVNPTKYEMPVIKYVNRLIQPLYYGLFKLGYFKVVNNEFISDDGWLLENYRYIKNKEFQGLSLDISLMTANIKYYYLMTLESPTLRTVNKRSYMKIQDLFAKIGGIANALIVIITIISSNFLRFKYLLFIRQHSFCMRDKSIISQNLISNNALNSIIKNNNLKESKEDNNPDEKKFENSNISNNNNNSYNQFSPYISSLSQFKSNVINNPPEMKSLIVENSNIRNTKLNNIFNYMNNNNLINNQQHTPNENDENPKDNDLNMNKSNTPSQVKKENDIYPLNIENNRDNNNIAKIKSNNVAQIHKHYVFEFKQEIADILADDNMKEFQENESISYLKYFSSQFISCCISKKTANKYSYEFERVKKLLDIKTFKHFLIEAYYMNYNNW